MRLAIAQWVVLTSTLGVLLYLIRGAGTFAWLSLAAFGVETEAEVLGAAHRTTHDGLSHVRGSPGGEWTDFWLHVRFEDPEGEVREMNVPVTYRYQRGYLDFNYGAGATLDTRVRYLPWNPEVVACPGGQPWFVPLLGLVIGGPLVLFLAGFLALLAFAPRRLGGPAARNT